MTKYFGTDGIRGVAGTELTADLAAKTGLALAHILGGQHPLILLARDTRISGNMLECALAAGLMQGGADVQSIGTLPTPALAFLTAKHPEAAGGIMISASHNPFYDNGIKIFGGQGFKLSDEQETEIERLIDNPPPAGTHANMGRVRTIDANLLDEYVEHIIQSAGGRLDGLRLLIDCANGAASSTAERIFTALGAYVTIINSTPDGVNINQDCGSTHMQELQRRVREGGFDLGVAFDGDADRCLLTDEKGNLIDGDRILAVIAKDMKESGTLRGRVVGTVVTNLGLVKYLMEQGICFFPAKVGDRYVLERMKKYSSNLGGEQSGHTILLDFGTTGDGQLTAARFAAILARSGKKAGEIAGEIELFPQVTININVPNEIKKTVPALDCVKLGEKKCEEIFGGNGRVLVRASGTEPKVRVMVEGRELEKVKALAREIAEGIEAANR